MRCSHSLTERLGGAPRVADSPHLASALCQDGARLLVYEHCGREWLSLCAELRSAAGPELIVVAALPPEHAADVAEISAAASAVVAWRGEARPVLEAAEPGDGRARGADLPRAGPAPRTGPHAPALASRAAPGPDASPARRDAPPAPGDGGPGSAGVPPRRHRGCARPTPAPSRPSADLAGDAAFDAIFDDEAADEAAADAATPLPAADPSPPPASATSTVWPASVLSADDGLSVVRAALSGLWPEQRLRPVTEKARGCALHGREGRRTGAQAPLRPGAGAPRRGAPVAGGRGHRRPPSARRADRPGAVQAILLGIDDVLAALKEQSDDAGPEALRAIETVRHTLVKEAIDLTEALQQVAPPEVVEEITTSRKARRAGAAAVTRMVRTTNVVDDGPSQVPWGLVVVLVLAVVGGGRLPRIPLREPGQAHRVPDLRRALGHGGFGDAAGQGRRRRRPASR